MKNYIIGFLVVCLLVAGSFLFKMQDARRMADFPIPPRIVNNDADEPPLYLFLFFSRNNCIVCREAIQVLNESVFPFVVTGIVPGNELEDEAEFRRLTGAKFKLMPYNKRYKAFLPYYAPTLYGVSSNGSVLFTLPGVPGEKEYLAHFLATFYGKSLEMLFPLDG